MKKVILITGASAGMGKESAFKLIDEGHIVYGAARRVEKMQDIVDLGGHAVKMDVQDHQSIVKAVEQIVEEHGRIDVLWNNAGYGEYGAVEDVPIDLARRQFDVNLFGLADVTKQVLPVMRKQKSGLIINTSSMGGKIYTPLGAWYHATKHALEGWSDCLRIELKPFGIDVVVLEPGIIRSEWGGIMVDNMMKHSGDGHYAKMARAMQKAADESYNKSSASSPASVIADAVSKIIRSKNPKPRYAVGKMAKPMIALRKWIGDRLFDKALLFQVK